MCITPPCPIFASIVSPLTRLIHGSTRGPWYDAWKRMVGLYWSIFAGSVVAISKGSSQSAEAETPRLRGPIPTTQQLRGVGNQVPAPGPPERIWLFIFMFWRRQPTQAIGLCVCVCGGEWGGGALQRLSQWGAQMPGSPKQAVLPWSFGEATCGPTPPPKPPDSHSCPTAESPFLPLRTSAPASHPVSRCCMHMRGCGAGLGFLFPIDHSQMKPASAGGKRFLSKATSLDDREWQFAGLCPRRPSPCLAREVITTT